jgi:hypothetical protein
VFIKPGNGYLFFDLAQASAMKNNANVAIAGAIGSGTPSF